jgi:DNA-binding LytR/AlgR family response regulator
LFVVQRKLLFGLQDLDYVFTDSILESFLYEYRKDAWVYVMIVLGTYSYRFILSRLRGEAVPVGDSEETAEGQLPERFLVRKLGKEFVVKAEEVEWLEAAGNYVNLHVGDRVYPLRATMSKLIDVMAERGFARIHRSRGVNLNYVESITPLESGDCTVELKSGTTLSLSRRYRDALRQQFRISGT